MTQAEFATCMRKIKKAAISKIKGRFDKHKANDIISNMSFSWDNAAIHKCSDLLATKAEITEGQRLQIPPHCCDLQQPIEHAHGRFKARLLKLLRRRNKKGGQWWPKALPQLKMQCEKIWEESNSESVVTSNVERLLKLYKYVHTKSKGNWAPKKYS
jgi:hypothetical protein